MRRLVLGCLLLIAAATPLLAHTRYPWPWPWIPWTHDEIRGDDILARDRMLSDDYFEGRMPGTMQGEKAAKWIAEDMRLIGLKPGNHGSYYQTVPAVNITLDIKQSHLEFATPKGTMTPRYSDDIVYWTPQFASDVVTANNSPLVFVGYGIVAPEYHWNDYAGVDVKGKTVVILINDPGNEDANPDPKFFRGRAMTYYGRWTYKFEEAARQGAAAAIIVHETKPAGYAWHVTRNSNYGLKAWLAADDENKSMVPIEGWIQLDTAKDLFARAGMDYLKMKAAANKPGFHAVPMNGESLSAETHSELLHYSTHNVIGMIPGSKYPDEYVLFTAHWDHLGEKEDIPGHDKIYNGAIDNALGVSSILELGEAFEAENPHPQRSIAIVAFTLEEQYLLGSEYFSKHPPWPANHIVGGINLDANLPEGRAHDLVLYGNGASELEDLLANVLKTQHRVLAPDPQPETGMYYRSDHLSLAKVGVPMLSPMGGYDLIDGGTKAGKAIRDDYFDHHYHQPSDEYNPDWDMSGPVEDLQAYFEFGNRLANSRDWPNWYVSNEFRTVRDKSMAQ